MNKSCMPKIAKMLGLEINEEFKLEGYVDSTFRFTMSGLEIKQVPDGAWVITDAVLRMILAYGDKPIIKPFRPAFDEPYYSVYPYTAGDGVQAIVEDRRWKGSIHDLVFWTMGNVFRTKELARVYEDTILVKYTEMKKAFESELQEDAEND